MSFAPFRQLVLAGLQETSILGTARQDTNGWCYFRTHQSDASAHVEDYDKTRSITGQDVEVRFCDFLAKELSVWQGLPKIELYWSKQFRDEAVQMCRSQVREHGDDFVSFKR
jgi:hypothetical protein